MPFVISITTTLNYSEAKMDHQEVIDSLRKSLLGRNISIYSRYIRALYIVSLYM